MEDYMADLRHANKNYFLEQWRRTTRWYNALHITSIDNLITKDDPTLLDKYYTFFINAYHLKDWVSNWLENNPIENDKRSEELEEDFKKIEYLRDLRSICEGAKHFILDNNIHEGRREHSTPIEYNWPGEPFKDLIVINGRTFPAEKLVTQVMHYWTNFFQENGLNQLKDQWYIPLFPRK